MADDWFYSQNGQQAGPVMFVALQSLAASGKLQPGDLIWQQGMPNWAPASTVQGLFQAAPPIPPATNYPPQQIPMTGYAPQYGSAAAPLRPMADAMSMMAFEANKKSVGIALVLWFFFGIFGAHRFYLRRQGAVAMLILSFIGWGSLHIGFGFLLLSITSIWAIVDVFLIYGWVRDWNMRLLSAMSAGPPRI
jgi:TM2 domain-containing membrane protein YozV